MKVKALTAIMVALVFILSSCTVAQDENNITTDAVQSTAAQNNYNTPSNEQPSNQNTDAKPVKTTTDSSSEQSDLIYTYPIVSTGITELYSDIGKLSSLSEGDPFYGQDGNYQTNMPSYTDNGDGTVTDNITGLMWQQTMDDKMTIEDAFEYAQNSTLAGYDDWRMPTIKELFSLIKYTGQSGGETAHILFIDTDYFDQPLGDTSIGEREIDAQVWSATYYVGLTMRGDETVFGVNFIDGRIKGYGTRDPRTGDDKTMYARLVRGNTDYGENNFVDNGDRTVTDLATGLMWQISDSGDTYDWEHALSYCENLELAGYDDWRLPSAKELQSIVDYTKSLQTTNSPAIDDIFTLTAITDTRGQTNYGFYWTATTHLDGQNPYAGAAYVAFGEALGQMNGQVMDVHGSGAVRSDPKSGSADDYPQYFGPQGDIRYIYNFVLAVRTIE